MRVKVFTLRFDPRIEGFDDSPLRDFVRDKEILSVRDNFFLKDETPYWSLFLIPGVGAAKLKRYGHPLLARLGASLPLAPEHGGVPELPGPAGPVAPDGAPPPEGNSVGA